MSRIADGLLWVDKSASRLAPLAAEHGIERDDLTGAGRLALVLAAEAFDDSLGVPFEKYAAFRIRCAMIDEIRHVTGRGTRPPALEIHPELASRQTPVPTLVEQRDEIRRAVATGPDRQRQIGVRRGLGQTDAEIAADLRLHPNTLCQAGKRIRRAA